MQKTILISLVILLLYFPGITQTDSTRIKTEIKKVTVFLNGAQVFNEGVINLNTGISTIIFQDIQYNLNVRSIQVKFDAGEIVISSIVHRINYLESPDKTREIKLLEKKKEELNIKMQLDKMALLVNKQEEELLLTNKTLAGKNKPLTVLEIRNAADFYREKLSELKSKKIGIDNELIELSNELQNIELQLKTLNSSKSVPKSEVVVTVMAKNNITSNYTINYIVPDAGWIPKYDLRANEITAPLEIYYKADVFQKTGYDWKDVKVTLSTANPSEEGSRPLLATWYLDFNRPVVVKVNNNLPVNATSYIEGDVIKGIITGAEDGMPIPGATVTFKGTNVGTVSDIEGRFALTIPKNAKMLVVSFIGMTNQEIDITKKSSFNIALQSDNKTLDEVVVIGYGTKKKKDVTGSVSTINIADEESQTYGTKRESKSDKNKKKEVINELQNISEVNEHQTTIEFPLDKPYTIPNDGKKYTVELQKISIPVVYEYSTVPKLDNSAYLVAQLTGWEKYNLLTGESNLFLEGTFVGKSKINVDNTNDTLTLSFGKDNNIVVERKQIKEFSRKRMLTSKVEETSAWEISIKNNKSSVARITVEDQFPVSSTKEIEVERVESSSAVFDENKGLLTWKIDIQPGETKKQIIKYIIKYPKNWIINN